MQAVIDEAGQVVIPKRIREQLGLAPGNVVAFTVDEEGSAVIRKLAPRAPSDHDRFERRRGSLKLGMSTDEFMALMRGED